MSGRSILLFVSALWLSASGCIGPSQLRCVEDEECIHGGRCSESGVCVECVGNDDCEGTDVCLADGTCGRECERNEDCPDGVACDNAGSAPTFTCLSGPACTTDSNCTLGRSCIDGECVSLPPCDDDAACEPYGRICESTLFGQKRCVPRCQNASDCGFGRTCQAGRCRQQCFGDQTCLEAGTICDGGVCVAAECRTLADCGAGELCTSSSRGRCQAYTACEVNEECASDDFYCGTPSPCPPGFDCTGTKICLERARCVSDRECGAGSYCEGLRCRDAEPCSERSECAEGTDCVAGMCVPFVCRGELDCDLDAGEICVAGECRLPPAGDPVTQVRILTVPRPLKEGEQVQLVAIALTASGEGVPGQAFTWSSFDAGVAAVDSDGLLTATGAGTTMVMVSLRIGTRPPMTHSVIFRVLDPVEEGDARVVVFDAASGEPIPGATVVLDGVEGVSGDDGVALFPEASAERHEVQIYAPGYDRIAVSGAVGDDLAVPTAPDFTGRAAGFTGSIAFNNVTSTGGIEVGLAGGSRDELLGLSLGSLLGEMFTQNVSIPFVGEFPVPAPGAMTLKVLDPIQIDVKSRLYASAPAGLRSVWSFAGRLDMDALGFLGGGGADIGGILTNMLPYFGHFEHGLSTGHVLVDVPLAPDAQDVNGNGDTTEVIPDWNNPAFPSLNLRPSRRQNLRARVVLPPVPSGLPLSSVVLLAGAKAPQLGYTLVGLSATSDSNNDGTFEPQILRMAPLYAGLEAGAYAVVAMAMRGSGGGDLAADVTARIHESTYLPSEVALDDRPFLPFADGVSVSERSAAVPEGTRTALADAGAGVLRVVVQGLSGRMVVYLAADAEGVTVPPPPEGFVDGDPIADAGAAVFVDAVSVSGADWSALTSLGGATLGDLDTLADGYSRTAIR